MAYVVKVLGSAEKDLAALPEPIRLRLWESIQSLADDPRPAGIKKLVDFSETYRIRVGQFRIGYQIRDRVLLVTVIGIGKRSEFYPLLKRRVKKQP